MGLFKKKQNKDLTEPELPEIPKASKLKGANNLSIQEECEESLSNISKYLSEINAFVVAEMIKIHERE